MTAEPGVGSSAGTSGQPPELPYSVSFDVAYPEGGRNRLTVFFRLILAIPIVILLGGFNTGPPPASENGASLGVSGVSLLIVPVLLMIVFRHKYPRWWFDFNLQLLRFSARVGSYIALLRDEYPSTDEEQAVRLTIEYPIVSRDLHRLLPLVKWLLAIPHVVVLAFACAGAIVAIVIAWFSILLSGRYPRSLFDYVVGVQRYALRVFAYALVFTTDRYPPFSLSVD